MTYIVYDLMYLEEHINFLKKVRLKKLAILCKNKISFEQLK
jgi:hypothetical protein